MKASASDKKGVATTLAGAEANSTPDKVEKSERTAILGSMTGSSGGTIRKSLESLSLADAKVAQSLPGSIDEEQELPVDHTTFSNKERSKSDWYGDKKNINNKHGFSRSFENYQLDDLNLVDEDDILDDLIELTPPNNDFSIIENKISTKTVSNRIKPPLDKQKLLNNTTAMKKKVPPNNGGDDNIKGKSTDAVVHRSSMFFKPFTNSEWSLFDKHDDRKIYETESQPKSNFASRTNSHREKSFVPHQTRTSLLRLRIGELAHRRALEQDIEYHVTHVADQNMGGSRSAPLSPKENRSNGSKGEYGVLKHAFSEITLGSKTDEALLVDQAPRPKKLIKDKKPLKEKSSKPTKLPNGYIPTAKNGESKPENRQAKKSKSDIKPKTTKATGATKGKPPETDVFKKLSTNKKSEIGPPKQTSHTSNMRKISKPGARNRELNGKIVAKKDYKKPERPLLNVHGAKSNQRDDAQRKRTLFRSTSKISRSLEFDQPPETGEGTTTIKRSKSQLGKDEQKSSTENLKSIFNKSPSSNQGSKLDMNQIDDNTSFLSKKLFDSPKKFFARLTEKLNAERGSIVSLQDSTKTEGTSTAKELVSSLFGEHDKEKPLPDSDAADKPSLLATTFSITFGVKSNKKPTSDGKEKATTLNASPKAPIEDTASQVDQSNPDPSGDKLRKPSLARSSLNNSTDDEDQKGDVNVARMKRDPSTKLIQLCKKGQWHKVENLLGYINEKKLNLSLADDEGLTPLMFAVKDNKLLIAEKLLLLGADLEEKTKDGRSVAHIAAMYAKEDVVRFLISNRVLSSWRDHFGPNEQLPIHMAVTRPPPNAHAVVNHLLKIYPESRYIQDANGCTPLMLACETGNLQMCRELLHVHPDRQVKIRRKDTGDGVLHAAVRSRNPELVRLLCENGALVNVQNNAGQTPLYLVAATNVESMLKVLFHMKADANITDNDDKSPLHIAAEKGYTNIVEILADKFKASVFARTKDGSTLMHIASKYGHSDTALAFLKRGVPLYMPNKSGALGLHLAATLGHTDVVKALLNRGTPVDSKTKDNYTALHVAVQAEKYEVVEILLGHGADVSIKGGPLAETALHVAAGLNNTGGQRCAEMLLKSGADVNSKLENGETALHIASKTGNVHMIKLLLAEGAEPLSSSVHGETPLHVACKNCHFRAAKTLLEYIENNRRREECTSLVNRQTTFGETPMHLCAESSAKTKTSSGEDVDLINLLLDYGGEINIQTNTTGETVLHYSARAGNEEVMKTIVRKIKPGAVQIALNRQSKAGWSPLMEACQKGHLVVAKILLDHHARVDVFDDAGKTALHLSAENGHVEICDLLVENKAFINSKTKAGITPLHLAALNGHRKVVVLLVQAHKAFVDAVNNEAYTPLHLAAQAGQLQVCTTLLSMGANPNAHESRGRTPLHLAAESDHPEVVKLFLKLKPDLTTLTATDENGLTCAHIAAMKGSVAVVKELMMIDRHVVIDAKTRAREATTLHMAAEGGFKNVVKILLAAGADPLQEDGNGMTPVQLAAKNGFTSILEVFDEEICRRCSRKTGLSALHIASYYGQMEFVRVLLVNVPSTLRSEPPLNSHFFLSKEFNSEYGFTPLHMAALSGHEGLVRLLLNFSQVQVDATTSLMSITPLHLAAQSGHVAVVGMLLSRSTQQLHIKDNRSRTALHLAASNGHLEMVSLLLAQGSNVNVLDQNGWTALHHATSAGHSRVVQLLIESGADPFAETREGKVALCFAAAKGHINVLVYLMQQPHDTTALLDDRKFLYDLMLCGKNHNNRSVEEFVLLSPAPIETAVKLSSLYKYLASNEKERSRDLSNVAEYCETLAVELLSLASANHNPALLLKAVDNRGRPFIDVLIENEQKAVVSHASVQRYLTEVWSGGIKWGFGKFTLFFVVVFLCPPAWIFFSLPFAFRVSKAPIIKFVCHLVSHIYFTILLIIETLCVVRPIYEIDSFWPLTNEWILLFWLSGLLVAELSRLGGRSGLAYVRLVEIMLGSIAVLLHLCAFIVPPTMDFDKDRDRLKLQQTLLYLRNQLFSITLLFGFTQYLEFLTVHHLFGPWAIIIRDLMYDLTRFLVILFLFMSGFTISISSIFQPAFSPALDDQSKELMKLTSIPETIQMLYFSLFGLVDPTNMPPLHLVPELGQTLLKIVFGIYLLVVIIVLINLLIAMMSDTYQRIQAQSDVEWKFGRAKLIREMNKKSATPVPINMFTKFVSVLRVALSNRGKMCTSKAQDDLRQLEDIDAYSMSEQAGRISPTIKMLYSKLDDAHGRQSIAPETGINLMKGRSWKIEKVINWKTIVDQYRKASGQELEALIASDESRG